MKSSKLFLIVCLAASLILAACGNAGTNTPSPSPMTQVPTGTLPPQPATLTATKPAPVSTASVTPEPCSPEAKDYCIVDAFFVFQLPINPPGIDTVDRGYPYGGTEGGTRDPHHGVEFYNASGTPVRAAAGGTVYFAGDDKTQLFTQWPDFYGNLIILKHQLTDAPFGILYTLYAHLSKEDVITGDSVIAGQKIGEVGASGSAQGSHLHFEVRVNPNDYASTLDPELWLVPHASNGTLAITATDSNGKNAFPTFNVQFFPNRDQPAVKAFEVDSYAKETVNPVDPWGEIAALGDQPTGWYRITFLWEGVWIERWVEIQSGKLTRVAFMVK
jgi:hypothetical protein